MTPLEILNLAIEQTQSLEEDHELAYCRSLKDLVHPPEGAKELGSGVFGTVYHMHDQKTRINYAVKIAPCGNTERWLHEVELYNDTLANIDITLRALVMNPRFSIPVNNQGKPIDLEVAAGGDFYISVLEYIPQYHELGKEFERGPADWINCDGSKMTPTLTLTQVEHIIAQILMALEALWTTHHVVHRDLKMSNILLVTAEEFKTYYGQEPPAPDFILVKLIDFGHAKVLNAGGMTTTKEIGNRAHNAPEIVGGYYNYTVDIFSVAMIAFHLLSGYFPGFYNNDLVDDESLLHEVRREATLSQYLQEYRDFHEEQLEVVEANHSDGEINTIPPPPLPNRWDEILKKSPRLGSALETMMQVYDDVSDTSRADVWDSKWYKDLKTTLSPQLEWFASLQLPHRQ